MFHTGNILNLFCKFHTIYFEKCNIPPLLSYYRCTIPFKWSQLTVKRIMVSLGKRLFGLGMFYHIVVAAFIALYVKIATYGHFKKIKGSDPNNVIYEIWNILSQFHAILLKIRIRNPDILFHIQKKALQVWNTSDNVEIDRLKLKMYAFSSLLFAHGSSTKLWENRFSDSCSRPGVSSSCRHMTYRNSPPLAKTAHGLRVWHPCSRLKILHL